MLEIFELMSFELYALDDQKLQLQKKKKRTQISLVVHENKLSTFKTIIFLRPYKSTKHFGQ